VSRIREVGHLTLTEMGFETKETRHHSEEDRKANIDLLKATTLHSS